MFEIPGSGVVAVSITEEYVMGNSGPKYIRKSSGITDVPTDEEEQIKATAIVQWWG